MLLNAVEIRNRSLSESPRIESGWILVCLAQSWLCSRLHPKADQVSCLRSSPSVLWYIHFTDVCTFSTLISRAVLACTTTVVDGIVDSPTPSPHTIQSYFGRLQHSSRALGLSKRKVLVNSSTSNAHLALPCDRVIGQCCLARPGVRTTYHCFAYRSLLWTGAHYAKEKEKYLLRTLYLVLHLAMFCGGKFLLSDRRIATIPLPMVELGEQDTNERNIRHDRLHSPFDLGN